MGEQEQDKSPLEKNNHPLFFTVSFKTKIIKWGGEVRVDSSLKYPKRLLEAKSLVNYQTTKAFCEYVHSTDLCRLVDFIWSGLNWFMINVKLIWLIYTLGPILQPNNAMLIITYLFGIHISFSEMFYPFPSPLSPWCCKITLENPTNPS